MGKPRESNPNSCQDGVAGIDVLVVRQPQRRRLHHAVQGRQVWCARVGQLRCRRRRGVVRRSPLGLGFGFQRARRPSNPRQPAHRSWSIGASSRSPAPMTLVLTIGTSTIARRTATTASRLHAFAALVPIFRTGGNGVSETGRWMGMHGQWWCTLGKAGPKG